MDRKFYTDNFEQLLKEKSDEFRMYPSKRVWHSIYNDLHPGRKWPSVAVSMLLIISLLFIGYLNTNDNRTLKNNIGAINVSANTNTGIEHKMPEIADRSFNNSSIGSESINLNSQTTADQPGHQFNTSPENVLNDQDKNNALTNSNTPAINKNRLISSIDNYIRTNQLFSDLTAIAEKNAFRKNVPDVLNAEVNPNTPETLTELYRANAQITSSKKPVTNEQVITTKEENKNISTLETLPVKTSSAITKKTISAEEKAWMEDYALHNKSERKKWKDRVAMELYATPSIGFRKTGSSLKNDAATSALAFGAGSGSNKTLSQKPSLGLEAGFGLSYSFAKNLRLKGGVQVNYTSYGINADQTNHPILTTLMLNDPGTGHTILSARTSTLSNSSGLNPVTVHNNTYQVSIPVGIAMKLAGSNKMEWYAGASIQPSFVLGGATHFISSDYNNYVSDPSLLRKWNMNTSFETYINYKLGGYSLQVGPQFRYQLLSTYNKKSTTTENLYNMGLKVGLIKGF